MNTVKSKIYLPSEVGAGSGSGGGGGDLSFDGNRDITREVIGLKGVVPGGSNMKVVLENVLYPAVAPEATIVLNDPIREIGAPTEYTLDWTVTKKTNPIIQIIVDGADIEPTGISQSGIRNGNFATSTGSFVKTISVTDGAQNTVRTATVQYLPRMFFGSINKTNGITDADILAITGSELRTDRFKTFKDFGGGGLYPIFVVPVVFGMPGFTVNGLINNDFTLVRANSPMINSQGATVMVNVIVFNNFYHSSLNSLAIV